MERALKIVESCVIDQAIYSKAIEIKWKEKQKFNGCVLMMGIVRMLMMLMYILSKRFSGSWIT